MQNVQVTEDHLRIVREAITKLVQSERLRYRTAATMLTNMHKAFRENDLDAMSELLDKIIYFQTMPATA